MLNCHQINMKGCTSERGCRLKRRKFGVSDITHTNTEAWSWIYANLPSCQNIKMYVKSWDEAKSSVLCILYTHTGCYRNLIFN